MPTAAVRIRTNKLRYRTHFAALIAGKIIMGAARLAVMLRETRGNGTGGPAAAPIQIEPTRLHTNSVHA
jgi:hypothetical protein